MFRSGFVAIIGRPNMGKSTLLNKLVGQKIAITSPVAQTTRHRIKGVVTSGKGQIIFLDTPGFSKPLDQLGQYLTQEGQAALSEADAFMVIVDVSEEPGKGDQWVAEQVLKLARAADKFILLVMNKSDCLKGPFQKDPAVLEFRQNAYRALFSNYEHFKSITVSAKTGKNMGQIPEILMRKLPQGPAYYPEDSVTDQRLREISAEIIREKVLLNTREEIPHSVAIGIDRFEETEDRTNIHATLYVDQKSQKGIVIGEKGSMIKRIGTDARKEIETLMEGSVYLDLNVKVKENWRKDAAFLKALGLAPPLS